jgi:hypothetical protein
MSTAAIPAAQGPITSLVGRSGFYRGYAAYAAGAGVVRLWSGPSAGVGTMLDALSFTAAGTAESTLGGGQPCRGRQYQNGIFVELVSGTMPTGAIDFDGPHS